MGFKYNHDPKKTSEIRTTRWTAFLLKVPQRVAPGIEYVPLYIHPECNKEVDNYRRPHGKKRNVDEVFTNGGSGNAHPFTNGTAYTKHMPFNKKFKTVHTAI